MHLKSKDHFQVPVNKNRFPGSEGHQISQVSSPDQVPIQHIYIYIYFNTLYAGFCGRTIWTSWKSDKKVEKSDLALLRN